MDLKLVALSTLQLIVTHCAEVAEHFETWEGGWGEALEVERTCIYLPSFSLDRSFRKFEILETKRRFI